MNWTKAVYVRLSSFIAAVLISQILRVTFAITWLCSWMGTVMLCTQKKRQPALACLLMDARAFCRFAIPDMLLHLLHIYSDYILIGSPFLTGCV